MFDMFVNSMKLFLAGRLFQDQRMVMARSAIGAAVTAGVCIGAVLAGLPLPAAIALAALVGGALQPYLYKDLRYH